MIIAVSRCADLLQRLPVGIEEAAISPRPGAYKLAKASSRLMILDLRFWPDPHPVLADHTRRSSTHHPDRRL